MLDFVSQFPCLFTKGTVRNLHDKMAITRSFFLLSDASRSQASLEHGSKASLQMYRCFNPQIKSSWSGPFFFLLNSHKNILYKEIKSSGDWGQTFVRFFIDRYVHVN